MIVGKVVITRSGADPDTFLAKAEAALSPANLRLGLETVVLRYLQARIKTRFKYEGDDAVGKWAPLRKATWKFRRLAGYPPEHPINIRSGQLFEFATQTHTASTQPYGATLAVPGKTKPKTEIKFIHAQKGGTDRSGGTFPARPIVAPNRREAVQALTLIEKHIMDSL